MEKLDAVDGAAFKVGHKDGAEDVILLAHGPASVGGLTSDGIVTVLRMNENRPDAVLVAGASRATLDGRSVLDLGIPVRWLSPP